MNVLDQILGTDGRDMLFELMALVMVADGEIQESEVEKIGRLVSSRPEFGDLPLDEILERFRGALTRVTRNVNQGIFDARIEEISQKLPEHKARLLAFGMATAVALADGDAHENELSLLKILARAFSLSELEVEEISRCIKAGDPLEVLFPLPHDEQLRAYVETMTLAIAADGRVSRSEIRSMAEEVIRCPELKGLSLEQGALYIQRALDAIEREGLEARLSALGRTLSSPQERFVAFLLALKMVLADGEITQEERHILARLEALFALPPQEVKRAMEEATGTAG